MPLIGLIDPSHKERAAHEPGRWPKWDLVEDVLAHAATAAPKWSPWTYELLKAAIDEWQERDYISTTMLTGGCPRSSVLERREEFILSFDEMYAAVRGSQVHRTLEHAVRPGGLAEARFFTTVHVPHQGEVTLSCSPDLITQNPATLQDFKVTENPPVFDYPWKSHTMQVQLNRYIVNHAERWEKDGQPFDIPFNPRTLEFEHLALVYLGPKGPKVIETTRSTTKKTPTNKTIKRRVPDVWSNERVEEEMLPRLAAMKAALDSYPEWPDGAEEVWGGDPDWRCPGPPLCHLPNCLAKRYPNGLKWRSP